MLQRLKSTWAYRRNGPPANVPFEVGGVSARVLKALRDTHDKITRDSCLGHSQPSTRCRQQHTRIRTATSTMRQAKRSPPDHGHPPTCGTAWCDGQQTCSLRHTCLATASPSTDDEHAAVKGCAAMYLSSPPSLPPHRALLFNNPPPQETPEVCQKQTAYLGVTCTNIDVHWSQTSSPNLAGTHGTSKKKSDGRGRLTSSPPACKSARSLTLTPPAGALRALLSFEAPPPSASGAAGTSRALLMPDGGASDAAGALSDEPSRMYVFMNTGCDIILIVFASMGGRQVGGDVK